MTTGTGIAIAGMWVFASAGLMSDTVGRAGARNAILIAIFLTIAFIVLPIHF